MAWGLGQICHYRHHFLSHYSPPKAVRIKMIWYNLNFHSSLLIQPCICLYTLIEWYLAAAVGGGSKKGCTSSKLPVNGLNCCIKANNVFICIYCIYLFLLILWTCFWNKILTYYMGFCWSFQGTSGILSHLSFPSPYHYTARQWQVF